MRGGIPRPSPYSPRASPACHTIISLIIIIIMKKGKAHLGREVGEAGPRAGLAHLGPGGRAGRVGRRGLGPEVGLVGGAEGAGAAGVHLVLPVQQAPDEVPLLVHPHATLHPSHRA